MKRIVIDFSQPSVRTALVEDNTLVEIIIDDPSDPHISGNIYAGLVSRVLPNRFVFINIGNGEHAFMDLNSQNDLKVKQGDRILVQISRAAQDGKAAIATTELCFKGRYIVIFNSSHPVIGISKKIKNNAERKRLKRLTKDLLPENCGAIIRTEAAGAHESDLTEEIHTLVTLSKKVIAYGKYVKAPAVVYEKSHPLYGTLQALLDGDVSEVVVNSPDELIAIGGMITTLGFDKNILMFIDSPNLFAHFRISGAFEKAFDKRIWLKSGGHIVIEKTEACIVIDVNTGKLVCSTSRFTTNCEAAKEIARQLRLRNLSGIIIIDFVSMSKTEDNRKLHQLLEYEVGKDRVRVNVVGMTKLGLMQLTRQRIGKTLGGKHT